MTDTQTYQQDTDWLAAGTVGDYEGQFVLPEIGTYVFRLVEKSPDELKKPEYQKTGEDKQAKFFFEILDDPDYADARVMQWFAISFNERSALRPFVEAGIGRKLKKTDKVGWKQNPNDPDSVGIENLTFRATLTHNVKGPDKIYPKLSSPLPLKPAEKEKYVAPF
jgi:hypothetical protein